MKLELKHLAAYLPYNLKVIYKDAEPRKLMALDAFTNEVYSENDIFLQDAKKISEIKPILRPLSNLRDKDEHGEFIHTNIHTIEEVERVNGGINNLSHYTFEFLVSKHFDVYELIELGLAVDVNSL